MNIEQKLNPYDGYGLFQKDLTHFIWVPTAYCYFPEYTVYVVLFWATISIEIIRSSRFRENHHFVVFFWGGSGGPQALGTHSDG